MHCYSELSVALVLCWEQHAGDDGKLFLFFILGLCVCLRLFLYVTQYMGYVLVVGSQG